MKEGVLAFGTQLHSRINSKRSVSWERRGDYRHCGGRLQKIQSISIYQRGSCLEESPSPRMFPFSLLIVGGIDLVEKHTYHKSMKKQNQKIALPGNSQTAWTGFSLYRHAMIFFFPLTSKSRPVPCSTLANPRDSAHALPPKLAGFCRAVWRVRRYAILSARPGNPSFLLVWLSRSVLFGR